MAEFRLSNLIEFMIKWSVTAVYYASKRRKLANGQITTSNKRIRHCNKDNYTIKRVRLQVTPFFFYSFGGIVRLYWSICVKIQW